MSSGMTSAQAIAWLGYIGLVAAVLIDSSNRFGKPKWGWVVAVAVVGYLLAPTNMRSNDPLAAIGVVAGLWLVLFGVYRLATRKKPTPASAPADAQEASQTPTAVDERSD